MIRKIAAAGVCAAAFIGASSLPAQAQGNGQLQSMTGGYSLDQLKQAIRQSGDITLMEDMTIEGETLFGVAFAEIKTGVILQCPAEMGGKCIGATFFTGYPSQVSADAADVNESNRASRFGWLSSHEGGRVAFGHGVLLNGMTLPGFLDNIRLNTAIYVMRGKELLDRPTTVSLPGADLSSAERAVDANHRPALPIGLSIAAAQLFDNEKLALGLANAYSDAQTYGELRKIANDLLGD